MKYFKKILALSIISFLAMTANAQQSPNKEAVNENDFWVGRTHYEDDVIFDNIGGSSEPEIIEQTNSATVNTFQNEFLPIEYKLYGNYPNPFNPSTTIKFFIPVNGYVTLAVYDAAGREVSTLISEQITAGTHEVIFGANGLASGLYFCKITVNNFSDVKKMILVK
jgi:hypothetical protein